MNTLMTILGVIGWIVGIVFVGAVLWTAWVVMASAINPDKYRDPEPPTDPDLPRCSLCGWVEGVNADCMKCQRDRKVLP
jgi:hypothetical protein